MRKNVMVIPCYNELRRLSSDRVRELVEERDIAVLLVDDGSSDGTAELLKRLAAELAPSVEWLSLPENRGKAEAVRVGLRHAIERGASIVGFADADFSTGPAELKRLAQELERLGVDAVLGSRIARLGAAIDRSPVRHYAGRLFASIAALTLRVAVYDTQCGAKWFRVQPRLKRALEVPFSSRWAFDVELLGRLLGPDAPSNVVEIPLIEWHDAGGSKLQVRGMIRGFIDVVLLFFRSLSADR